MSILPLVSAQMSHMCKAKRSAIRSTPQTSMLKQLPREAALWPTWACVGLKLCTLWSSSQNSSCEIFARVLLKGLLHGLSSPGMVYSNEFHVALWGKGMWLGVTILVSRDLYICLTCFGRTWAFLGVQKESKTRITTKREGRDREHVKKGRKLRRTEHGMNNGQIKEEEDRGRRQMEKRQEKQTNNNIMTKKAR